MSSSSACRTAASAPPGVPPGRGAGGGLRPDPAGVYGATKAAVIALARTTAREHGRYGIRSNIVGPEPVVPEGPDAVGAQSLWAVGEENVFDQKQADYLLKDTPLHRLTDAEDIANAVLWLSSDRAARRVTGQLISVSGGYTMP